MNSLSLVGDFHFLRPSWLLACIPVTVVWWFFIRTIDAPRSLTQQIAPHLLKPLTISAPQASRTAPAILLLCIWGVCVLALAGPSWRQEPSPFASDESNLWVILKLTSSMESEDLLPSRLERTRLKLHDLMELRSDAATGLLVYSSSAHLVMPPTDDHGVIDQMLQALDSGVLPGEGDALPEALAIVADHIERDAVAASVLIIADSAEASQLETLEKWRSAHQVTTQWFVPIPPESKLTGLGIQEAAGKIDGRIVRLSPDGEDISRISKRASNALVASTTDPAAQWRDEGYWLLWPIVVGAALWSRRGWSLSSSQSS